MDMADSLAVEQGGVFVKRVVGLVAPPVNPTHAINQTALDIMDVILLRPLEAFLEGLIGGIEGVGVEPDFHRSC